MNKMIAYCGLDCEKCDAYIATKNNDDALREKTAKLWAEMNNAPIVHSMINCDGCRMDGKKTPFCESMCEIRQCALQKGVQTCGNCKKMTECKSLEMILNTNETAKDNLNDMKNKCNELIEKAEKMFERNDVCAVSSVTENGYPRIVMMKPISNCKLSEIYFSTGASSNKVKQYAKNPKAGVTFFEGGDSVTLLGNMTVVEDVELKARLWKDWLIKHFPLGAQDHEYCVLKFVPTNGTIYIGGEFETVAL